MRYIFIAIAMLFSVADAETFTLSLKQIDEKLKNSHPLPLYIKEQKEANSAQIEGEFAPLAFVLSLNSAKAKPDNEDGKLEYGVELSKSFLLGDQRTEALEIAKLNNRAISFELDNKMLAFSNSLKSQYHQSCLITEQKIAFEEFFEEFQELYSKKLKAYKYQEISKKELLQLEIEKEDLKQKLENLKATESILKQTLLDAIGIKSENSTLLCQDLHPMEFNQNDSSLMFENSTNSLKSQIEATKKSAKFYDRNFESVELSVGYDDEIDTKRYGVGLSLPLSFSSKKDEYKKISAIYQQKALILQKKSLLIEKNRAFKELKANLENKKKLILSTKSRIDRFKNSLLPLIEQSYRLGESSVIEYLLSKQKLWQLQELLNEHKKAYYKSLFELYTVAEIKEI